MTAERVPAVPEHQPGWWNGTAFERAIFARLEAGARVLLESEGTICLSGGGFGFLYLKPASWRDMTGTDVLPGGRIVRAAPA